MTDVKAPEEVTEWVDLWWPVPLLAGSFLTGVVCQWYFAQQWLYKVGF